MKIADKVKILVISLVLIPCIIIIFSVFFFGHMYFRNLYGTKEDAGMNGIANPILAFNGTAERVIRTVKDDIAKNPDQLLDASYIQSIDEKIKSKEVYFIIKIDNEIYYQNVASNEDLEQLLPEYGDNDQIEEGGLFVDGEKPFYLRQEDYTLSDGRTCSIFFITYTQTLEKNMKRVLIEMFFMVVVVLILISGYISINIYTMFLHPLKALQEGTERIRDGNLNEDVEVASNDEIGQVCQSFNEMRVKLKESVDDRMKQEQENRELITNISHDLKTPITAIKGYVEGIMDGVADTPEKMDRYIRTIYNKTNEMDALINELSLYTQIDNNSIPYNFEKLKVENYFHDCMEDISIDMEQASVELSYENECPADAKIVADPEQLRRVINNIVTNAVKYNKKRVRTVQIQVKPYDDEQIYIGIRDNGEGIKEEDLPNIFKRMYRTDASRNSQTGGRGLGLAIARKIVEEHGGRIWAESKPDEGTLIAFTLNTPEAIQHVQDSSLPDKKQEMAYGSRWKNYFHG